MIEMKKSSNIIVILTEVLIASYKYIKIKVDKQNKFQE